MKVEFLKEYTARTAAGETRTVAAGTVLDISPDKAARLVAAGLVIDLDAVVFIWRDFVFSADTVYRQSAKSSDSWIQHKNHLKAALHLCKSVDISEARLELDKALAALSGVGVV